MSRSGPDLRQFLPPQFMFWLDALGLEIVLDQPENLLSFAAQFFDVQLACRSVEMNNIPIWSHFHKIAADNARGKHDTGPLRLRRSDHAYHLDRLFKRDSHVANITFPDDELEYKSSVERVMEHRLHDIETYTMADMYIPRETINEDLSAIFGGDNKNETSETRGNTAN